MIKVYLKTPAITYAVVAISARRVARFDYQHDGRGKPIAFLSARSVQLKRGLSIEDACDGRSDWGDSERYLTDRERSKAIELISAALPGFEIL